MKKILTGICVVAVATGCLTGCSTNTQNENTGVGALSGAALGGVAAGLLDGNTLAIGLSAIGGALIGGYVGHSMDHSDANATNHAMSDNDTNMPSTWTNKKTGVVYQLTPTSGMMTYQGNPNCRKYKATATANNSTRVSHGIACRSSNGVWVMKNK